MQETGCSLIFSLLPITKEKRKEEEKPDLPRTIQYGKLSNMPHVVVGY